MSTNPHTQLSLFGPSPARVDSLMSHRSLGSARSKSPPNSPRFCVLGSGSGGNCSVLAIGNIAMLIDAGFGPRTTAHRLGQFGLALQDLDLICLTHLDRDHFRPIWMSLILQHRIRLFLHRWHVHDFQRLPLAHEVVAAGLVQTFDDQPIHLHADLTSHAVRLPHDEKGTCGFLIETPDCRIGYATDLGRVPQTLIQQFTSVDLLAIESNYDPQLQRESSRPAFLKHRIMGGKGHLSNQQAFDAIRQIDDHSPTGLPRYIVLLHRSAQCNSEKRIAAAYTAAPHLWKRVTLSHQRRRSPIFTLHPAPALRAQPPLPWNA